MPIEYGDETLRRLAEDPDFHPRPWSTDAVGAYRRKVQLIDAAVDERDLRAMRGLRLEQLPDDREGTCSIRLSDHSRLILKFKTEEDPVTVILEIVDLPLREIPT